MRMRRASLQGRIYGALARNGAGHCQKQICHSDMTVRSLANQSIEMFNVLLRLTGIA